MQISNSNFRRAALEGHAVTIECSPVDLRFTATCGCGWRSAGAISGRADGNVIAEVLAHWNGIEQSFEGDQ